MTVLLRIYQHFAAAYHRFIVIAVKCQILPGAFQQVAWQIIQMQLHMLLFILTTEKRLGNAGPDTVFQSPDITNENMSLQRAIDQIRQTDFPLDMLFLLLYQILQKPSFLLQRTLRKGGYLDKQRDSSQQCFQQYLARLHGCCENQSRLGLIPVIVIPNHVVNPLIHEQKYLFLTFRFQSMHLIHKQNTAICQCQQSEGILFRTGIGTLFIAE